MDTNTLTPKVVTEQFAPKPKLPAFLWNDAEQAPAADYLIKHVLGAGELSVVYGPPACGKSFFSLDMASHVATGGPWRGHRVKQGPVVYVAAEGQNSFARRIAAFKAHHAVGDAAFACITTPLDLRKNGDDVDKLIGDLALYAQQFGQSVALIVIDTLSRCFGGGEENNSADMAAYIANCERVREKTGAHVLSVHHTPKAQTSVLRGHGSLEGAVNTAISVQREEGEQIAKATVVKQKDGQDRDTFRFELRRFVLGEDDEGDEIASCVVVPVSAQDEPPKAKLSDNQALAKKALANYCAEHDTSDLSFKEFEVLMTDRGIVDGEPHQVRSKAGKLRVALERKGLIYQREGRVCFVPVLPENS
jgi:KaiC/GvpD/RAD55 family RecA-like ATPase